MKFKIESIKHQEEAIKKTLDAEAYNESWDHSFKGIKGKAIKITKDEYAVYNPK